MGCIARLGCLVVLAVLAVGLVAGLYNWYLMDPGFFGK